MLLLIAPRFDDATEITHDYASEIAGHAGRKNWEIDYLQGEDANPNRITKELRLAPDAFFFMDHGSYQRLYGQRNGEAAAAITLENAELLKGMVAAILACQSARDLGEKAVKEGCKAYIGYVEVAFVADDEHFKEAIIESFKRLLNGETAQEAYKKQLEKMRGESCPVSKFIRRVFGCRALRALRKVRNRVTGKSENKILDELLYYNSTIFVLKGDGGARI